MLQLQEVRYRQREYHRGNTREQEPPKMRPYDEKYHLCRHCRKDDTHRIYIRSKEKGRKFVAIAWYCVRCKMFETGEQVSRGLHIDVHIAQQIRMQYGRM
ncbi:MAG: hypothetical protein ACRD8W_07745 [Nitrososphaeraceae archaeon]